MQSSSPCPNDNVLKTCQWSTAHGDENRISNVVALRGQRELQDVAGPGTSQSLEGGGGVKGSGPEYVNSDHDGEDRSYQDSEDDQRTDHLSEIAPRLSTIGRRSSFIEEEEAIPEVPENGKQKPVSWNDLPHKGQLAMLTMARLSEPLTQTSLQAYMFYQLRSFDPSLADAAISAQAGLLQGSFTAAQFVTAILWGRAADADWGGRKKVLLIGLLGTCISCVGFGFSRSFTQAAVFRILGGALNGNVGVMRTMIAEIIQEKK